MKIFIKNSKGRILILFFVLFWRKFVRKIEFLASSLALFFIIFYKTLLSGILACGGVCRFYPSCSEYAFLAYKNLPFWKATFLVFKRLLDCRPFGPELRIEPDLMELKSLETQEKSEKNFNREEIKHAE